MEIIEDRWLSAIFGHGVFKIDIEPPAVLEEQKLHNFSNLICGHASQQRAAMYYAKVDTTQIEVIQQLTSAGLYVVDVNVTFGIDTQTQFGPSMPAGTTICEVQPEQHDDVLNIAASCFQYSRFHLDPFVPDKVANQIKRDWVMSYIQKERGERLFAALINEQVVGFLAVIASESQGKWVQTIDLMGVSKSSQRKGTGRSLVVYFINRYKGQCDFLEVGTQIANVPSIRLYEKCGFSVVRSSYVLHMYVPNATPNI